MKISRIAVLIITPVLLMSGCATRRQMQELKIEVNKISTDINNIRQDNARLDSLFKSNIDQSRKLNADFAAYVARLDERMQMVEARLEDAITLINRASGAIESRSSRSSGKAPSDSTAGDSTQVSGKLDCQKVYTNAYFDVVRENYELAISGFENYLKDCSNTALADNAQYWIGECHYLQKNYEQADRAFGQMIEKYPSSERLASAKLKKAKSMYNLRQKTKAKEIFEEIIKSYPGTEEAQDAAQMLDRYR